MNLTRMHLGLVAAAMLVGAMLSLPSAASSVDPPAFKVIDVFDAPAVNLCDPADQAAFALVCAGDAQMVDVAMLEPIMVDPVMLRTDVRMHRGRSPFDAASWFDFGVASIPPTKPPK